MKKLLGCGGLLLLIVGAFVLAVPVAGVATVAVPALNPSMLESIMCAPGTKLKTEEVQGSKQNGPTASKTHTSVYCVDAEGTITETRDVGYGALAYFPQYYAISLVILLILVGVFSALIFVIYTILKQRAGSTRVSNL